MKPDKKLCTRLQERLLRKLGENAYPFFFKLPPQSPCSVTLQVIILLEYIDELCRDDYKHHSLSICSILIIVHFQNNVYFVACSGRYGKTMWG